MYMVESGTFSLGWNVTLPEKAVRPFFATFWQSLAAYSTAHPLAQHVVMLVRRNLQKGSFTGPGPAKALATVLTNHTALGQVIHQSCSSWPQQPGWGESK